MGRPLNLNIVSIRPEGVRRTVESDPDGRPFTARNHGRQTIYYDSDAEQSSFFGAPQGGYPDTQADLDYLAECRARAEPIITNRINKYPQIAEQLRLGKITRLDAFYQAWGRANENE